MNKFTEGNNGRPPKYKTAKELEERIESYFHQLAVDADKPTITGLALWLGFASRQSIYKYKEIEKFSYTIKRAILAIENIYEQKLFGNSVAGPIFALKNLGWKDKTEHEYSGSIDIPNIKWTE